MMGTNQVTKAKPPLLVMLGLAMIAALALLGAPIASASGATQHWYSLHEGPLKEYNVELPSGVEEGVSGHGKSNFELGWVVAGVNFEVGCTGLVTGGTITNPSNGTSGKLGEAPFALTGCAVMAPYGKGCTVPTRLEFVLLSAEGVGSAIRYAPNSGTAFITLPVTGCSTAPLNGNKTLTGRISASAVGASGEYAFTSSSGSELLYGGQSAYLRGTLGLETQSGGIVELVAAGSAARWHVISMLPELVKTKVAEGTSTPYASASGSTTLSVSAVIAGIKVAVNCSGAGLSGALENPTGEGAASALGGLSLSGCSEETPKGPCTVAVLEPSQLSGSALEVAGEPAVQWAPTVGSTILKFNISGCPTQALNGQKTLIGRLITTPNSIGTSLFSTGGLTLGGQTAAATGQTRLQNGASEAMVVAP